MRPPPSPEITVIGEGPPRPDVMEIGAGSDLPARLRKLGNLGGKLGRHHRKALAVAAVLALALTAFVFYQFGSSSSTPAAAPRPSARPSASPSREPTPAEIYTAVAPSVVSIEAAASPTSATGSAGTGIIVNGEGAVLTAFHVVKGAGAIRLIFADGSDAGASIAASDPANDIAILMPGRLPSMVVPAVLGRADRLAVGDG